MLCSNYDGVCWWCVHKADEYLGCPISLKRVGRDKRTIECRGYFCSFQCAVAWGQDNGSQDTAMLLFLLARKNYESDGYIEPAPPRETLKLLGGPLTIEQFRTMDGPSPKRKQRPVYDLKQIHKRIKTQRVGRKFSLKIK